MLLYFNPQKEEIRVSSWEESKELKLYCSNTWTEPSQADEALNEKSYFKKPILHNIWPKKKEMWFSVVANLNEEDNTYALKKKFLKV